MNTIVSTASSQGVKPTTEQDYLAMGNLLCGISQSDINAFTQFKYLL